MRCNRVLVLVLGRRVDWIAEEGVGSRKVQLLTMGEGF